MAKSKRNSSQAAMDLPKDLRHLPDSFAALVPLYRACIVRFNEAVGARDFDAAGAISGEAHDLVEHALSFDRFQRGRTSRGWHYCFYDVARIFDRLTRAAPGTIPLFGQSGDFETVASTTRVRFKTDGVAGCLGMFAYEGRTWGFSLHAVELDRPFFSETGFRSFTVASLEVGERTDDVSQWCLGHLRHWWNGEGGRATKYALRRIRPICARPSPPPPPPVEDDFDEEGPIACSGCSVDLSQMDEYGECPDDGAAYCPLCYAQHQESCADCVPLDDSDEEDRTAIGNGYRSEPVGSSATQLSLF